MFHVLFFFSFFLFFVGHISIENLNDGNICCDHLAEEIICHTMGIVITFDSWRGHGADGRSKGNKSAT